MNALAQRLAAAVIARGAPGVRDVVPALGGLAIHFDPAFEGNARDLAAQLVAECLEAGLPKHADVQRTVDVPVCYEAEFAFDLEEIGAKTKIPAGKIPELHAAATYRVLMIGFAPGHAYMGGLDPRLAVPRRATPRLVVPAGAVAIANEQTVVYPYAISGGWNVVGRTPLRIFDAGRQEPSLFAAGDRVKFHPITRAEFLRLEKA